MASRIVNVAKSIDDFIIDKALQPGVNLAAWYMGIPLYSIARVCVVLGAGVGAIWLHRFDPFPSADFYQDIVCLTIMVLATYMQIRVHEARAPRVANLMPAARATGLLWRTAWLLDLAMFPFQWPVEGHVELVFNFAWTVLVVLPYWIICCRRLPPPVERRVGAFTLVPVLAR